MRDPGDAATLSNVTAGQLGHYDSEFRPSERRYARLWTVRSHSAALVTLEQSSAPKNHSENTHARALRRRRCTHGPVTLGTCICADGLTAPQILGIV